MGFDNNLDKTYIKSMQEEYEKTVNIAKKYFRGDLEISFDDMNEQLKKYAELNNDFKIEKAGNMVEDFKDILQIIDMYEDDNSFVNSFMYVMSFLLEVTKNVNIYKNMMDYILRDKVLSKENKLYLYYRFIAMIAVNPHYEDKASRIMMESLYKQIYEMYMSELRDECEFIPKAERNQDFVIVMIGQLLDMGHGPTKTLLDRCYVLKKKLKKDVFIINTAELLSPYGAVSMFKPAEGMYLEKYCQKTEFEYRDASFPMFQCTREMPNVDVIREIIGVVKTEKPYYILTIGGNSIVSDVCSNIVPTLSIATLFSRRAITCGTFQVKGNAVTQEDRLWIERNNLPDDHIIESLFTFSFKEQTHTYTRKDLGLPEDGFIAIIVGGRLDDEVDDECEKMLISLTEEGINIAFLGVYKRYKEICRKHSAFAKRAFDLGFQNDVLAIDECCDLYINPRRLGGGTSVAEALYKGLPAVTFDFGDVGVAAGEDFYVNDYEDMYNTIIRYSQDKEFYDIMSKKARERGMRLIDSEGEFIKVIEKMEKSNRF